MSRPEVVVVGAGVAGLAATAALAGAGARVTLLERKPYVGGRAYSYEHPALSETIDSQHVLLGCCTNLIHLCGQAGVADHIRWYDEITFLEPGGRRSVLKPGGLPSPAHSAFSFLRAPMLDARDKAGIAAGLMRFVRGVPESDEESFAAWLKKTGQTERSIRHFWEPVAAGALNDGFERCSTRYAAQVFYESFLKSAEGGRLGIPAEPLSEFYAAVARHAEASGAEIRLLCGVGSIQQTARGTWLVEAQGELIETPAVVLAIPFEQVTSLLTTLPDDASVVRPRDHGARPCGAARHAHPVDVQ
jgi:zeta-carotene desaturase